MSVSTARVPARTTELVASPWAASRVAGIAGNLLALAALTWAVWTFLAGYSCDGGCNVPVAAPLARVLPIGAFVVEALIAFALRREKVALMGATLTLLTLLTVIVTGIVLTASMSFGMGA